MNLPTAWSLIVSRVQGLYSLGRCLVEGSNPPTDGPLQAPHPLGTLQLVTRNILPRLTSVVVVPAPGPLRSTQPLGTVDDGGATSMGVSRDHHCGGGRLSMVGDEEGVKTLYFLKYWWWDWKLGGIWILFAKRLCIYKHASYHALDEARGQKLSTSPVQPSTRHVQ